MKNLITNSRTRWLGMVISTFILLLGSAHAWAADNTVVGVACNNTSNYTVKLNVNRKGDGDDWQQKTMTKAGITFEGKKLYITSYEKLHGGLGKMQFQYYSGSTHKGQQEPISSWNTDTHDNRIYNYDGPSWYGDVSMTNGARVYFDASTWSETGIKLVTGHANHQKYYALSAVTNTKLYYGTNTDTWSDAMGFGIVGGTSRSGGNDQWLTDVSDKAAEYTGWKHYGLTATSTNNAYLVVPGGKAGEQPTVTYYATAYSSLNSTQTIKYAVGVNGGTPAELTSGYVPANIAISSYKFASGTYNSVSSSSGSVTLSQGGSNFSATVSAARTATTTYTVSNIHEDYSFVGWYSAASGGTLLSSELSYTFYPTSATTAYARFSKENNHSVTISRYCTSTSTEINNTSAKVGEVTYSSIEAPDIHGYSFVNWTVGSGLTKHASDAVTSNPIRVITAASGDYTLTANYTEVLTTDWKLIGDNTTNSPFGDNYSYASGKAMSKKSGASATDKAYKTLDITHTGTWGFKVATASGNSYTYGWGTSDGSYITFNRSKSGNQQDVYTGEQHQLKFNPDGLGEYEFEIDYTAAKCSVKVTFPTVYTVTYGKGTGGNTVSASYSSTSFDSGTKVQSGKTVRFTQTAKTGYQFKEWNTNSYGTGTRLSTDATYDHTVASTNNVYAIFSPKQYTITLNDQDATTAVSPSTVKATYKSLTLSSSITNPEKDGYTFGGWYSATGGGGYEIINTSGALQASKSGYTDATGWTKTDAATLYAKWTQVLDLDKNGGTSDGSLTVTYKKSATSSHTAATRTGYTLAGYYDDDDGGNKIINADGSLVSYSVSVASYIRTDGSWGYNGTPTLYAQWTANQYDVTLKPNGATTGSDQVVRATFDADMPTTTKTSGDLVAPTKTGYTFGGYSQNSNGSGTLYYTSGLASNHAWDQASNVDIYAKWTANPYTVTLDVDEDNKGTIAGADESASVTFDAAPTTIANRPTAANGYALDGYYTDQLGEGKKVINGDGTWIASVTGYTDGSKNWIHDGNVTLYAYYKKAEITELTLAAAIVGTAETDSITVTPTISPSPTGTTMVCWEIQYSNGTALPSQPAGRIVSGNTYRFKAPTASATYRIQATLRTGSSCDGGTELSTLITTFQVAGEHAVTIRYQDSDGRTLAASTEITGKPLEWTENGDITPPSITGYTFHHWLAGDGITLSEDGTNAKTGARADSSGVSNIYIKANYDGTLTAVYNKKKMIFFNNTLGWSDVYVYFYNTDKYWSGDYGSGALKGQKFDGDHQPYYEEEHGHMTQIEGTNIWYFDYEAAGYSTRANVVFTEANQHDKQWFWKTNAARRSDHVASLQMFVPLTTKTETKNETDYYSSGYWMNYPENTGYSLLIYNQMTKAGATKLYEIPFEFTEDFTMPMELVVDLEAGQTYGFEIKRADGKYYSNTGTMTANTTNWSMTTNQSSYCGLRTTAAGNYTFRFYYSSSDYRMDVTYPVAVNDYRIVYTDLATWSKDAHTASWSHPSRVITKNSSATETKKDTVSFFWSYGSTPAIKYQKCTGTGAGSVSWNAGTSIDVSGFSSVLTKKGVYNFIFEQPAGGASISLVGVEPYTGNYYIRTDCAGSTKWANFSSMDHQMTYSDYAEEHSGYSHYYTHWVTSGTNVKFCIANDYSQCITDTLVEDKGTVVADITTEGNANAGRLNSGNASIRFMWDYKTNKVSRAYISGSTNISDRFLVLEGDSKMYDKDGSALSISGLNPNEANLIDDQNFVYEREIQVNTKARAKLTAKYNDKIQYFKGSEGAFAEGTTIELLGGDASGKHSMRIVYDFKTNRLVTAYVPSGTIDEAIAINADLMIVREHQGAGQQLLFEDDGALSEVHTVYGVMRFNRWTLNNKSTADGHSPVGDPKSIYERSLYWISFPFDVNLSDVFGFGTYGVDWIIEYYDGAERATNGYWIDSDGFWKMVMPAQRADFTLEAGKGYVLAIDIDAMKDNNETFWANNIEQVELFFPSATNVENITQTTAHTIVPEHECTIDRRTDKSVNDINKDRTKADSHWNMIGIPSYANYGATLTSDEEGTHTITWNSNPYTNDLPFLYEWNMTDDSYTVQSGTTYPFKAMHAYMVQYHGDLYWSLASATPTPSPIVARRAYAEKPQNAEFRLELQQNEKMVDQTFVNMKDAEEISAGFKFDEDLCKEFNAGKANIYTLIENYLPAAGNTLPMSDQTTLVPVGVKTTAAGEYTFAMPEGTSGVSVVLIDNIAGTRTNLALSDYTVALGKGDLNDRFMLEIAPIKQMPTGIELLNGENGANGVRKVLIDGLLYIVKDGKMFDAQGRQVK